MKQSVKIQHLSINEGKKTMGGKGLININIPIDPRVVLNGICGFLDGWNGRKHHGHC